jgi:hypothetical protein
LSGRLCFEPLHKPQAQISEIVELAVIGTQFGDQSADLLEFANLEMRYGIQRCFISQGKGLDGIFKHAPFYLPICLEYGGNTEVFLNGTGSHQIQIGDIPGRFVAGLYAGIGRRLPVIQAAQQDS